MENNIFFLYTSYKITRVFGVADVLIKLIHSVFSYCTEPASIDPSK